MSDIIPPTQGSALALIQQALAADVPTEKLRELLAVKKDWEADEARKAYNLAISEFQRRAPIIEKGDDANGKAYAAIDRIWRTIRPTLTELGLAVTWQKCELRVEGGVCHLEGRLSHRDGHGEVLVFDIPIPDPITNSSGRAVQNKAQVFGSAVTYAKRYATCAALGVVTGEDDDGNGGVKVTLDADQQKAVKERIEAWRGVPSWTQEREEVFWRFVGTKDLGKVITDRYLDILDLLKRSIGGGKKT